MRSRTSSSNNSSNNSSCGVAHNANEGRFVTPVSQNTQPDTQHTQTHACSRLPEEVEEGNREYKYKLTSLSREQLVHRISQLAFRLNEGNAEAIYEIGVEDDGNPLGLSPEEMEESLANLQFMATSTNCSMNVVAMMRGTGAEHTYVAEVRLRRLEYERLGADHLQVAVAGDNNAGKSSLIGVLLSGKLDNGHGSARTQVFKHNHEIATGITSSISNNSLYMDAEGKILSVSDSLCHSHTGVSSSSNPSCKISVDRVVTLLDLAGHSKYLKHTITAMVSRDPSLCLLCINNTSDTAGSGGVHAGIPQMALEHLAIAFALGLRVVVAVTKIDVPNSISNGNHNGSHNSSSVDNTNKGNSKLMRQLQSLMRSQGRHCKVVQCSEDLSSLVKHKSNVPADTLVQIDTDGVSEDDADLVPIFLVSNVTGSGLDLLKRYLFLCPSNPNSYNRSDENSSSTDVASSDAIEANSPSIARAIVADSVPNIDHRAPTRATAERTHSRPVSPVNTNISNSHNSTLLGNIIGLFDYKPPVSATLMASLSLTPAMPNMDTIDNANNNVDSNNNNSGVCFGDKVYLVQIVRGCLTVGDILWVGPMGETAEEVEGDSGTESGVNKSALGLTTIADTITTTTLTDSTADDYTRNNPNAKIHIVHHTDTVGTADVTADDYDYDYDSDFDHACDYTRDSDFSLATVESVRVNDVAVRCAVAGQCCTVLLSTVTADRSNCTHDIDSMRRRRSRLRRHSHNSKSNNNKNPSPTNNNTMNASRTNRRAVRSVGAVLLSAAPPGHSLNSQGINPRTASSRSRAGSANSFGLDGNSSIADISLYNTDTGVASRINPLVNTYGFSVPTEPIIPQIMPMPRLHWEFRAVVTIVNHPSAIRANYQPVVHVGNARQAARVKCIHSEEDFDLDSPFAGTDSNPDLGTASTDPNPNLSTELESLGMGQSGVLTFQFLYKAEYLEVGAAVVLREGRIRGIGRVVALL